ncbi:hypothetical protein PYCCODRAFT_66511 [Trametes coccinea BRFM310]|uniref:Uncharacterized protein n=1 Tax=Trametes coccinea (strain BRFM310) TaxID=1353009 RepID=A0A1Y2IVR8_TRAC3|nr:hypothetical protein PYCCODRAFT_66511 [Trametes coccinea BRFM310]
MGPTRFPFLLPPFALSHASPVHLLSSPHCNSATQWPSSVRIVLRDALSVVRRRARARHIANLGIRRSYLCGQGMIGTFAARRHAAERRAEPVIDRCTATKYLLPAPLRRRPPRRCARSRPCSFSSPPTPQPYTHTQRWRVWNSPANLPVEQAKRDLQLVQTLAPHRPKRQVRTYLAPPPSLLATCSDAQAAASNMRRLRAEPQMCVWMSSACKNAMGMVQSRGHHDGPGPGVCRRVYTRTPSLLLLPLEHGRTLRRSREL